MNNIQDSMDWTPEQALDEVRQLCDTSKRPDCLMIIAVWNEKGFDTKFWNVGMKCSEMIALLEIQKDRILEILRELRTVDPGDLPK